MSEQSSAEVPKRVQRSTTTWKIGEKFAINYMPSVEGMVVATRWMEEVFMVVFLAPPYQKEEGTWAEAALTYKNAAALVREPLTIYEFPFPKDKRILQEVTRANGNVEMLCEVVKYINKMHPPPTLPVQEMHVEPPLNPWGNDEIEALPPPQASDDRLSVHLLLSQQGGSSLGDHAHLPNAVMEKIMTEVSHRFSLQQLSSPPTHSGLAKLQQQPPALSEARKVPKKDKRKKKQCDSSSSSSASSSSSSGSSDSSSDSEVGVDSKGKKKGWVKCPFSQLDSRLMTAPREKIKSTSAERIKLRKALQNLYNQFTTLQWFVETIRPDTAPLSTRPYHSDIIWLRMHANYLDTLLLQPMAGPWASWNELIVDQLARSFLELMVRAAPERKYPDVIDGDVRKWMKKKRVGLTSSFGSVPAFLADAKITDAGIQPKGGWETIRKREFKPAASAPLAPRPKNTSSSTNVGEKKL